MHYCSVCKNLMDDGFEEITAFKHGTKVFWRREPANPICDKCLEEGWRINIDGNLVLVDLNDAYDPDVMINNGRCNNTKYNTRTQLSLGVGDNSSCD